jgi:hypothetical protein
VGRGGIADPCLLTSSQLHYARGIADPCSQALLAPPERPPHAAAEPPRPPARHRRYHGNLRSMLIPNTMFRMGSGECRQRCRTMPESCDVSKLLPSPLCHEVPVAFTAALSKTLPTHASPFTLILQPPCC